MTQIYEQHYDRIKKHYDNEEWDDFGKGYIDYIWLDGSGTNEYWLIYGRKLVELYLELVFQDNYEVLISYELYLRILAEKINDSLSITKCYQIRIMIYYTLQDPWEALALCKEFYAYTVMVQDERCLKRQSEIINNMIVFLTQMDRHEEAKRLCDNIDDDVVNNPIYELVRLERMVYIEGNEDVLERILSAYKSLESSGDITGGNHIESNILIAEGYKLKGLDLEADKHYLIALDFLKEFKIVDRDFSLYKKYSDFLIDQERYVEAIKYLNLYVVFNTNSNERRLKLLKRKSELDKIIMEKNDLMVLLEKENEKLRNESNKDFLTSTFNKKYITNYINNLFVEADGGLPLFSLMIFDIDYFKFINDNYGHLCGDYVIRNLCELIKNNLDDKYIFARTGGDEFFICFNEMKQDKALLLVEEILATVSATTFIFDEQQFSITLSAGLVDSYEKDIYSQESIIMKADELLYKAKNSGRNKVVTINND